MKRKEVILSAVFILIIFSAGLAQVGIEFSQRRIPRLVNLFLQKPTEANLRAYENELEDGCWISEKLRPWMQYLQFVLLREPGEKALMGRDGWLFYKPGVQYLIEPWLAGTDSLKDQSGAVSVIRSFHDQLAAAGIKLLVVPAPGKASIYPEMLTSRAGNIKAPVSSNTLELISQLEDAGIEVVNLFEVFSQACAGQSSAGYTGLYLSQDTHWSPEGIRLAAESVGKRIFALGWIKKGTVEYDLKPVTIQRYGDILRMMKMPQIKRVYVPEKILCTQVVNRESGEPYSDNPDSEILVLGDSFLRIFEQDEPGSGGFIAHLAHELKNPMASIVNDGGASTLVRQD